MNCLEVKIMKFDVVVGNPPYQESDGGAQASATPIYHEFYRLAEKVSNRYVELIFPARWYVGGKGLDSFREEMLGNTRIRELIDFQTPEDVFPNTNIRGGVSIILTDKEYDNTVTGVKVTNISKGKVISEKERPMKIDGLDIFVRNFDAVKILNKVGHESGNVSMITSPRKPYGFSGYFIKDKNFKNSIDGLKKPVRIYGKGKIGFVEDELITSHREWIDGYKIFTARSNNIGTELNDDNLNTIIGMPNEIVTETYLVIGGDLSLTLESATSLSNYLKTKFVRFLISLAKASQDASRVTYRFVPLQDFTSESDIDWSKSISEIDQQLYKKYGLSQIEIDFIEDKVKEME